MWLFLLAASVEPSLSAPEAEPWPRWEAHDPASTLRIDHSTWSDLLDRHVRLGADDIARFDYAGMVASDRRMLTAYLDMLAASAVSALPRDEQLAYWINLYNALTVRVVLDHLPADSIRDIDISPGLFANGPWGKKLIAVEGVALSLDDIEHRILRPIWKDPRIHYAVNCASLGCPDLVPAAYTAATADRMMTMNAVAYINHPRGVSFADGGLTVSRIYDWFEADFGGSERGVLTHLRRFANPGLRSRLEAVSGIDGYVYDWSLNAAE